MERVQFAMNPVGEPDSHNKRCRQIWRDVLMQALADCAGGKVPEYNGILLRSCYLQPHEVGPARAWFKTKDCKLVCEYADIPYEDVLKASQEIIRLADAAPPLAQERYVRPNRVTVEMVP